MDAIEMLLTRSSNNKLCAPAPQGEVLDNILNAGLRAPDHANLSPFKFIVCQNAGLDKLSNIFKQAAEKEGKTEAEMEKATKAPYRAPMVIVGICQYTEHEKVPRVEQIATTACAIQNMQMAAFAQDFNGIWRTGGFAHSQSVRDAFNLQKEDEIVGFLYLGTTETETFIKRQKSQQEHVDFWR
ncbi:MAG: NAD(P)H nitroreductase [Gammaproteobacteria bacterium]|nr:NAD(P)H nitroreductase [Gammaproteobacteria bacterium]